DGIIDEDEFASQRVVYASLARFNGFVTVDGVAPKRVSLGSEKRQPLGEGERASLDAAARRDFQLRLRSDTQGLDQAAWQDLRLEAFALADIDGDGALSGAELDGYAQAIAGSLGIRVSAGS
ncbi:MAG: hypothetical protein AAGF86_16390, partial [Pseudomonadota bacterium]